MSGSPRTASFTLVDRPLQPEEARQASAAIRETANILGYSPQELLKIPSCLIAEAAGGGFAGVCALKRYPRNCSEIVFILTLPSYRRQGIGSALFREAFRRLREEKQIILCISREPSILRLMEEREMQFVSEWRLPLGVQLAKFRHYANFYRFRESFRKGPMYQGQPPFRYALKNFERES